MKLLKIFVVTFSLAFVSLNGRFLYANTKYWLGINNSISEPVPLKNRVDAFKPLPDMATLVIKKIGVYAPMVFGVSNKNAGVFKNLEKGVVHYSDTPKPGMEGTSIILGHSSAYPWYRGKYGSVFALLDKLRPGDKFSVQYGDGRVFNFTVKQSIIFSPFASDSRLAEMEKTNGSYLILISCWPIGTNYKRIAVQAELI